MSDATPDRLSRRDVLGAGAALVAGMMVDVAWLEEARAQGATLRQDPRHAFADRLADLVIPATDTPGASAAGVGAFVLLALDRGMSDLRPVMLDRVRAALDAPAGGDFMLASRDRQVATLAAFDLAAYAGERPAAETPAFAWRRIKSAICGGYYTSEIGATRELVYEPVPGGTRHFRLTTDFRVRSNDALGGAL